MWMNYRPGWNNWNYYNMWKQLWLLPLLLFAKAARTVDRHKMHGTRSSNASADQDEASVSRMMGGYGPHWWNMWNSYRYWPSWNKLQLDVEQLRHVLPLLIFTRRSGE
ncbi:hypothetical protein BaRGS_00020505 [Batillaria attramentaria]|uniref:Secreted protein n=1 Tax=Batillaria attramentaria TaxID=370345 RepID=A0ABD0KLR1_9CAEN